MWRVCLFACVWSCSSKATPALTPPCTRCPPSEQPLARPLPGPFASIEAYCATVPAGADRECRRAAEITDKPPDPMTALEVLYVTSTDESGNAMIGCAIALSTERGWFVSPVSANICREPSYIELSDVRLAAEGAIAVVNVDVEWHTKGPARGDEDEATYTLTALCGMRGDTPACTPIFPSKCEAHAPVDDCLERGWEATWKLAGQWVTIDSTPRTTNALVPHGTSRLF